MKQTSSDQVSDPLVRVAKLRGGYGDTTILKNISFTIGAGEIFFIAGPSGCGKSTLMRYLVGLEAPTRGTLELLGYDLTNLSGRRERSLYQSIGVLFQGGALWSSMTLLENVALPLREHTNLSARFVYSLAALKLRQVGLQGFEGHFPRELSGGMRKRAALARALALDPKIVFLDEPSAGLDPLTSREMDRLIGQVRDQFGTTMVVVSHELESIRALADRILLLNPKTKTMAGLGTMKELLNDPKNTLAQDFFAVRERGEESSQSPAE